MNNTIDYLGVGFGYRTEISDWIFQNKSQIDFIEIIAELYQTDDSFDRLRMLCDNFKVIPHGVDLSIASETLDFSHLCQIKKVCETTCCPYYSEHLSITKSTTINFGHLTPILFSEEMLKLVSNNVKLVQDYIERPILLENIAYPFMISQAAMCEEEFFSRLIENTGCGLLLDITNLHINSFNHHFDPYQFIDNLPLDKLIQIHVSGGTVTKHGDLLDSHNTNVDEKSWELLTYVKRKSNIRGIIIERDKNFPGDLNLLLSEILIAKKIMKDQ